MRRLGSSPLTRGKPRCSLCTFLGGGLIPAHAGKTLCPRRCTDHPRAHPRSRGENHSRQCVGVGAMGSSPLTRGKRGAGHGVASHAGLIPAHAGKTSNPTRTICWSRAHPRSRGENGYTPGRDVFHFGSSPLTRGKRRRVRSWCWRPGLIPAHAGKTRRAR
mgnify:CR=1 FL=1